MLGNILWSKIFIVLVILKPCMVEQNTLIGLETISLTGFLTRTKHQLSLKLPIGNEIFISDHHFHHLNEAHVLSSTFLTWYPWVWKFYLINLIHQKDYLKRHHLCFIKNNYLLFLLNLKDILSYKKQR